MASSSRSIWQALVPLWLFLACVLAQMGCSCGSASQVKNGRIIACQSQHKKLAAAPPLTSKTIVSGALSASFAVTESGDAALSMPLVVPPGRAGVEPSLAITYNSSGGDNVLGMGFSLVGGSSITRCPKTMAIDGEIREVHYDADDAYCLDGKRLVVIAQSDKTIEYRTFPDTQVKIIGHFGTNESHFEAFLPSGWVVEYGKTDESRPLARGGVARAWLATKTRDARGNTMSYGYCFAESDEGFTAEYALDELTYTGFGGEEGTRTVSFLYGAKEDVRTVYSAGMAFQSALRLEEVQTSVDGELVRRYEFAYEQSESTGRTRLVSAQDCGADGACKPETRFQYANVERGFDELATDINVPLSDKASPMLFDVDRDGFPDYVVGDTTAASTPEYPITEWRIAKNVKGKFAGEKVALQQEWSFVQDGEGSSDPKYIQPELGTALDYTGGSNMGLFLHDVTGSGANHVVLLPNADLTFSAVDTNLPRPFPLGPAPSGLRSELGAVHLADITGDSVVDLIQCSNQETGTLSTWKLHVWQPNGFSKEGETITPLDGIPCNVEMNIVDINADSIADLLFPGYFYQGGVPVERSGNYSVAQRRSNGEWEIVDTGLRTSPGRMLFLDANGDGLPDAIGGDAAGQIVTWINIGKGFAKKAILSLSGDKSLPQTRYLDLAVSGDFNGDGTLDLLMPLVDTISPDVPRWVILQAKRGEDGTFERFESGIPFDAQINEMVELADPRVPRVADVTGDGADDVAIFLHGKLHIFRNRAADPDPLVGVSDGSNEHDIDDSAFVPNVEISYGHLTDDSDLYISRDDPANGCPYPRHCVVAPMRVVREYAVNDGNGGQWHFGIRYRDGRYDQQTHEFLGFGKRILTDLDTDETTVDHYDNISKEKIGTRQVYPFLGQIVEQWQWVPGLPTQPNPNLVEMTFADREIDVVPTNNGQTYFTIPTKTHTRRMQGLFSGPGTIDDYVKIVEATEAASMLRDSTVELLDFDEFRNVLDVNVTTAGVDTTMRITRTVKNDLDKWMLGLPDAQTECSNGAGLQACRTIKRTTNAFGEVETEETSSNDGVKDTQLSVRYERDRYGNVTKTLADDAFGQHREETTEYDANGVFPVKRINALGHETRAQYDIAFGILLKKTDPNGLVTEWNHDGFGRMTLEKRPEGSQTTITRTREKMGDLWRTKERVTMTGGADDETIFDSLGRPIKTFTYGPTPNSETNRIMQVFEYNRLSGEVARKSIPTVETTQSDQLQWDKYEFDALGRIVRHETPWGAVTTTKYDGLSTEVTVVGGPGEIAQKTTTKVDTLGRPITITDAKNGMTRHTYGPFNTLRSITDPGNDVMTWTRDAFGRVRQIDDPNRGVTTFVNDGFGDVVSSKDALGRTIAWERDALGRVTKRIDGDAGKTLTTTWEWDTATNGKGRLHVLTSPDAVKTYSYTNKGQLEQLMLTTNADSFAASWTYDEFGRSKTLKYPQPLGETPFSVTREYDNHGFVIGVRDASTKYWALSDVDDAGRYKTEVFGNGLKTTREYHSQKQALKSITTSLGGLTIQQLAYDYDGLLNLKSRTDGLQAQNKTERFRYDGLNRLTCAYFSATENPGAACAQSFAYTVNGNLVDKSDVGKLFYTDPKHPHAITNAQGEKFGYDEVGNQITRPGGILLSYAPFDLPKTITQGSNVVSFGYDGDEQRIRKTTPSTETLYFEDLFEQITVGNGKAFRYYVFSPERVIAVVTHGGGDPGTKWLSVDHVGSVESVTNDLGEVVEKRSYDVFGAKRNPKWGEPGGVMTGKTTKGFTGHEEDEEFGLVNMRGRLYDPRIARFTTPDPIIANIYDGQSLNSFSYVWNNPLSFVDPSGFLPQEPNDDDLPRITVHAEAKQDANGKVYLEFYNPNKPEQKTGSLAAAIGAAASTADMATTGASGAVAKAEEGFGSFVEGLVKGNLSDNDSWSATLGGVVGGLIPGVGLLADIRDLGAAAAHIADGREGAWLEMGAAVIGFVPGGDIAKGIAKGATKATTKVATHVATELVDDAAKVLRGSTATAADGLTGAQKTAGKVNAPRGPPINPDTPINTRLSPGPHAAGSVPASGPRVTAAQKAALTRIGQQTGCHSCGTRNFGTRTGRPVGDHQPPTALNQSGQSQQLYPQCLSCSGKQGAEVLKKLVEP